MTDNDKLIERLLVPWKGFMSAGETIAVMEAERKEAATALQAAQKEIERLTGERWAFEDAVSQAIGSPRFMDPPDGGDVSLPEQVDRMCKALEAAAPVAVTDAMVEAAHTQMMSELFLVCQPDRGDVFSFMDDRKDVLRAALEAALKVQS